ncbi:MAG: potassium transporter [Gammaproteobacteria bacterium]|nr:potassium transporter [Gammaproteobacteria bacterium]
MPATSELDRVIAVVLQYMRTPFLVLLATYAIGITGMSLMPGLDSGDGSSSMNLFHSFYFFTFTVTTTGFGEVPTDFSEPQRLWSTICMYTGVVAWLYAIGSFIRLVQHPELLTAIAERGFARRVRGITEPFIVICGFGDTGSLLARGLSDNYWTAVVIDSDIERIKALKLRDYRVKMFGLCGDSSVPKHLLDAGIERENCQALVALTSDDDTNLKIAVMARSLNPSVKIICRSTNLENREYLESVGEVDVVDPYDVFSRHLCTAIFNPLLYNWMQRLFGAMDYDLEHMVAPPAGRWILCGYGRMGRALHEALEERGIPTVIINPDAVSTDPELPVVVGRADTRSLREAGIEDAAGVVAGTDCDEDNLVILLSARKLKPGIFLVVRQNYHENELAFSGVKANLIMQPSLVTARQIMQMLSVPTILNLRNHLRDEGSDSVARLVARTRTILEREKIHLWTEVLNGPSCAVSSICAKGVAPTLGDIQRMPMDRERKLKALALVLQRGDSLFMLPEDNTELQEGDEILFCGTDLAHRLLNANLHNEYTLHYIQRGFEEPRTLFAAWLNRWSFFRGGDAQG